MGTRSRHGTKRRALRVGAGGIVVGGMVAWMGAAGAAQSAAPATITTDTSTAFKPADVDIATGDTVTWNFAAGVHNAQSDNEVAADPAWANWATPVPSTGQYTYTFTRAGTYEYVCQVHFPEMRGTITVTGDPVEPTPTATPTQTPTPPAATPTPSATPTATPGPSNPSASSSGSGTTPAPGSAARDSGAPAISGLRLKGIRHGARVKLTLSETATVTLRFKRRKTGKVLRTARLQVRAGTRTLTVRDSALKRGRYVVEVQARDSGGNTTAVQRASLRIKRARG
jgi:plastocyanin